MRSFLNRTARSSCLPILALAFGSLASAQATRTWVSGVGDDVNPCSRTAPCKTFAGAIAKTADGGEIDALDPGGFGAVTITKSITIDGGGGLNTSILASATNGIVINAGTGTVILRNLSINGAGTTLGLDGVKILAAGNVHLEHDVIFDFSQNGVEVAASAAVNLTIQDCTMSETALAGVLVATSAGTATVDIDHLHAYATHPAITGGANSSITVENSDMSTSSKGIKQVASTSLINVINCQVTYMTVDALESTSGASMRASGNTLSGNNLAVNPGAGTISSDGTNLLLNNTTNGAFNGTPITKL